MKIDAYSLIPKLNKLLTPFALTKTKTKTKA